MTDKMQVAQTIIDQMGGTRRLGLMVGANGFMATDDGVQFSFKGNRKMNKVVVSLNGLDLYNVEFWKISAKAGTFDKISESDNIYFDQLVDLFESETGLYLSL